MWGIQASEHVFSKTKIVFKVLGVEHKLRKTISGGRLFSVDQNVLIATSMDTLPWNVHNQQETKMLSMSEKGPKKNCTSLGKVAVVKTNSIMVNDVVSPILRIVTWTGKIYEEFVDTGIDISRIRKSTLPHI